MRIFNKIPDAAIPTPSPGKVTLYIDDVENMSFKNSNGNVSKLTGFAEQDTYPTSIPLGTSVMFEGDIWYPLGTYNGNLYGLDPTTPIRQYFPYSVLSTDFYSFRLDYGSLLDFGRMASISTVQSFNMNTAYTGPGRKINLDYVPFTEVRNAKLLINLSDNGTLPAVTLVNVWPGIGITKTALIQFLTGLPTTTKTATLKIARNFIVDSIVAADINFVTSKGYTLQLTGTWT